MEYCTSCGAELIRVPRPAENLLIECSAWGDEMPLGTRFNSHTGMRQFGIEVLCPNDRWYNNYHTRYVDGESLHDSDLPELLKM